MAIWAVAFAFLLFLLAKTFGKRRGLPPGPRGLPLLGNTLQIPKIRPWETYKRWETLYQSPLVYANALGQHILVLNNFDDAVELLEKRAAIYSDRPFMPMLNLTGWDATTGFMIYGDTWRQHRKVHQHLQRDQQERIYPTLIERTREFLENIASTPNNFSEHANQFSASILLRVSYGYDLRSLDDPLYKMVSAAAESALRGFLPGGSIVNTFPFLRHLPRWFPGAQFHDYAAKVKNMTDEAKTKAFEMVKAEMSQGVDKISIVHDFLKKDAIVHVEDDSLRDAVFTAFSGGTDTTSAGLKTIFVALATHPDVQKRAQAEISSVTGNTRLPHLDDRNALPYMGAIVREALRWRPPAPLGVPHHSTQDDVYRGYAIPKGTTVMSNIWAMTRDAKVYPNPESFKPERFLNGDGTLNNDDRYLTFGFGRRICPGQYLAIDSMWLATAQTLALFTLSNPTTIKSGKQFNPNDIEFVEDLGVWLPQPFGFSVTPKEEVVHLLA